MSWILGIILAAGISLMLLQLTDIFPPGVNFIFWLIGSLFLVAAGIWIAASLRHQPTLAPAPVRKKRR